MRYQIVFIRRDKRKIVARFESLQEAQNSMATYITAFGRYVLEEIAA